MIDDRPLEAEYKRETQDRSLKPYKIQSILLSCQAI